jgi:hypothetical protein
MSKESDGACPIDPNKVNIFNPLTEDDDLMITQDGFIIGTQDDSLMEIQEG